MSGVGIFKSKCKSDIKKAPAGCFVSLYGLNDHFKALGLEFSIFISISQIESQELTRNND